MHGGTYLTNKMLIATFTLTQQDEAHTCLTTTYEI
jgi:hypothetical protein